MPSKLIFFVADFNSRGELRSKAPYIYEDLQRIEGADELITQLSANLWRSPEGFEIPLTAGRDGISFRWRASAPTAGIGTARFGDELLSLSLLVTGLNTDADRLTLEAFQHYQLRQLHDSGVEPAFDLMNITERPLVATVNFFDPPDPAVLRTAALLDRCFAASYFRMQQLA